MTTNSLKRSTWAAALGTALLLSGCGGSPSGSANQTQSKSISNTTCQTWVAMTDAERSAMGKEMYTEIDNLNFRYGATDYAVMRFVSYINVKCQEKDTQRHILDVGEDVYMNGARSLMPQH